jgi:hypothetical protein
MEVYSEAIRIHTAKPLANSSNLRLLNFVGVFGGCQVVAPCRANSEQLQRNFSKIWEPSPRLEGRRKGKRSLSRKGELLHVRGCRKAVGATADRSASCSTSVRASHRIGRLCVFGEPLKEGAMRTIDLIGCALIGVSLASIACDISDFAQPQAVPVQTAPRRAIDYRSVDDRFSVFMAANCGDLDVKLASTRRDTVMKGIEACWNRFNPEL